MIQLAEVLPPQPNALWKLCLQLGVTNVIASLPRSEDGSRLVWNLDSLTAMKQRFEDAGFTILAIEASPPMDKIRLGLPGREEEIEGVCELLTNMGKLGIPVWCWNWMAVMNWLRTSVDTPTRGGALVTAYNHAEMSQELTDAGVVTEERLWENFEYFMPRVVPVAERAGVKMALHPDDPPVSPIRGIGRIFRHPDAFQRAIDTVPSDCNGITFCQGCFAEMGVDIPAAIRRFGNQGKIHFVHFRDVRGTADNFMETFHDDGQTNMLEAMRTYREIGFDGPMRPDHVPTMEGDPNDQPGYTRLGRLFAIGYIKGLMEAVYEST